MEFEAQENLSNLCKWNDWSAWKLRSKLREVLIQRPLIALYISAKMIFDSHSEKMNGGHGDEENCPQLLSPRYRDTQHNTTSDAFKDRAVGFCQSLLRSGLWQIQNQKSGENQVSREKLQEKNSDVQMILVTNMFLQEPKSTCNRLVILEKGNLLPPKESWPNSGDASEGHRLGCLPVWVQAFYHLRWKKW